VPGESCQNRVRFLRCKNHRQFRRTFGPLDVIDPRQLLLQDLAIQKQQRAKSLILRGSGHLAFRGQMSQKLAHLLCAHFVRMPFAVKEDETLNPIQIDLLGAQGIMLEADGLTDPIKEFRLVRLGGGGVTSVWVKDYVPVPPAKARNRLQNAALFCDIMQHNSR
jgi:hypothetical protein